jgi:hypothetical protein
MSRRPYLSDVREDEGAIVAACQAQAMLMAAGLQRETGQAEGVDVNGHSGVFRTAGALSSLSTGWVDSDDSWYDQSVIAPCSRRFAFSMTLITLSGS